ncbi:unnamed protein product [Polarella glacialis]|uniref:Uncharacterized protein n=1 Tax=Polarella glacialis TaxID=89957 RepID=A0A813FHT1_POLGL|nr:unnamed protein product [Polarella glacialis]
MGGDDKDCKFKFTYHHPVPGVTVLRGQFYIDTSVPAQVLFPRPEWLCLPSYKQCQEFFEMELEQMIGPGGAMVSITKARPSDKKASEHLAQIRALMAVLADSHEKHAEAEQDQYCTYKARVAVRWDLPEIGSAVHIVAPLDPDTLQPVSELRVHKAILSVFQKKTHRSQQNPCEQGDFCFWHYPSVGWVAFQKNLHGRQGATLPNSLAVLHVQFADGRQGFLLGDESKVLCARTATLALRGDRGRGQRGHEGLPGRASNQVLGKAPGRELLLVQLCEEVSSFYSHDRESSQTLMVANWFPTRLLSRGASGSPSRPNLRRLGAYMVRLMGG